MIPVPPRIAALKAAPASLLAKKARLLAATGRNIILLSSGELDFPTPLHVLEAAERAARATPVGYTDVDGSRELKEAIRWKFARDNGLHVDLNQIIVCNGSKQVMFNALMATVAAGDEVIVPAPYWAPYLELASFSGAVPVIARTRQADNLKLTPQLLERTITERTRWLIINNPVNPTGGVYTADELEGLASVLRRHPHVLVMADDLYEHIVFDGRRFATMASTATDLANRTLTINGVSKAYAMMGWRIGYGAGPAALIANMVKVQSQSTSNASTVSQAAAAAALNGRQEEVARRVRLLTCARNKVVERLSAIPNLNVSAPEGGFYAYIGCEGVLGTHSARAKGLGTDRELARFLLDEVDIVVLPGDDCGLSPFFRINFARTTSVIDEALVRIARGIDKLV